MLFQEFSYLPAKDSFSSLGGREKKKQNNTKKEKVPQSSNTDLIPSVRSRLQTSHSKYQQDVQVSIAH